MEKFKYQTNVKGIYWGKMITQARSPLKALPINAAMGFLGGFITIYLLATLTSLSSNMWLMAPFGASCVLAFCVWDAPLSQPRNIIGGHFISTLIGLIAFHVFGQDTWVISLGVGLAIALMVLTKTTHPPAGADPIVVILAGSSWDFLLFPTLFGSIVVVVAALIINNFKMDRQYPKFWI